MWAIELPAGLPLNLEDALFGFATLTQGVVLDSGVLAWLDGWIDEAAASRLATAAEEESLLIDGLPSVVHRLVGIMVIEPTLTDLGTGSWSAHDRPAGAKPGDPSAPFEERPQLVVVRNEMEYQNAAARHLGALRALAAPLSDADWVECPYCDAPWDTESPWCLEGCFVDDED